MSIPGAWAATAARVKSDFALRALLMWAAPLALLIGGVFLGLSVGAVSLSLDRVIDGLISRVGDIVLSFPVIILYMIILAKFGPSALNIIVVIAK